MTTTDEQLVCSLARGQDEQAARALYLAHSSELFGFAVRRLGDRQLAEELVQDVFTRVWRHAADFDERRGSFRTWLYGIARNALIDLERRRAARPPLADHTAEERAEAHEPVEQAVLRWQVAAALETLTPQHREIIQLAHFGGLTLREIAERIGVPLGTVKSRTSYAMRNLRLALDELGVSP